MIKKIFNRYDTQADIEKQKAIAESLEFSQKVRDEILKESLINEIVKQSGINKSTIKSQVKKYKSLSHSSYDDQFAIRLNNRLFPFIEKSTSSYAYFDKAEGELYLGVQKEILESILESEGQYLPNNLPVLKVVFDVHSDNKIDLKNKLFNLFTPTEYLLLEKNAEIIKPIESFRNIYLLLSNLFPRMKRKSYFSTGLQELCRPGKNSLLPGC